MNRLDTEWSLKFAHILCNKLALDLDADDYSSLPAVSELLMDLPVEAVLAATQHQLGIERCVKHGLDDKGSFFYKVLHRLNKELNGRPDKHVEDEDTNDT